MSDLVLSFDDIAAAHDRIRAEAHRTPVLTSTTADSRVGGQQSFRSGKIVRIDMPKTIADGAQTQFLGQYTFPVIRQRVDDVLTVSDAELATAMKFFALRMKMIVEPTGCLGAAAAFGGQLDLRGKHVGVVLSGGTVDMARFASLIADAA